MQELSEQVVITSRGNARVKQLRAAFAGQADGLIAIEGEHLVQEALRSQHRLTALYVAGAQQPPAHLPQGIDIVRLAPEVLATCTETRAPQGIAALLATPVWPLESLLPPDMAPLLLIAVGLQDPGNLGTLLRSAEAFGATGVLITPGTVNPWNGKCVRASAGSIFRMPLATLTPDVLERLRQAGVRLLAAVKNCAETMEAVDLTGASAILIGNEGSGLDPAWLAMAHQRVTVPCPGPVESLNAAVAGSLLLYEASRQRRVRL